MIIQGAHMNPAYMQKLQAENSKGNSFGNRRVESEDHPGKHLGQFMQLNPAKAGLTPARQALSKAPGQEGKLSEDFPDTVGKAFANEIVRRLETQNNEQVGEDGETKDSTSLRHALGSTMDWLRDRYGDETAAAAAGMILQSTSSNVNEDTLGDGLLNTLKFIDRNFGTTAGDEAIAKFNASINPVINNFFDNGKDELFFAVETPAADASSASQDINARFIAQVIQTEDDDDESNGLMQQLLNDLRKELEKTAELTDLTTKLEAEFSPAQANTQTAMTAYQAGPQLAEPQFTSVTV